MSLFYYYVKSLSRGWRLDAADETSPYTSVKPWPRLDVGLAVLSLLTMTPSLHWSWQDPAYKIPLPRCLLSLHPPPSSKVSLTRYTTTPDSRSRISAAFLEKELQAKMVSFSGVPTGLVVVIYWMVMVIMMVQEMSGAPGPQHNMVGGPVVPVVVPVPVVPGPYGPVVARPIPVGPVPVPGPSTSPPPPLLQPPVPAYCPVFLPLQLSSSSPSLLFLSIYTYIYNTHLCHFAFPLSCSVFSSSSSLVLYMPSSPTHSLTLSPCHVLIDCSFFLHIMYIIIKAALQCGFYIEILSYQPKAKKNDFLSRVFFFSKRGLRLEACASVFCELFRFQETPRSLWEKNDHQDMTPRNLEKCLPSKGSVHKTELEETDMKEDENMESQDFYTPRYKTRTIMNRLIESVFCLYETLRIDDEMRQNSVHHSYLKVLSPEECPKIAGYEINTLPEYDVVIQKFDRQVVLEIPCTFMCVMWPTQNITKRDLMVHRACTLNFKMKWEFVSGCVQDNLAKLQAMYIFSLKDLINSLQEKSKIFFCKKKNKQMKEEDWKIFIFCSVKRKRGLVFWDPDFQLCDASKMYMIGSVHIREVNRFAMRGVVGHSLNVRFLVVEAIFRNGLYLIRLKADLRERQDNKKIRLNNILILTQCTVGNGIPLHKPAHTSEIGSMGPHLWSLNSVYNLRVFQQPVWFSLFFEPLLKWGINHISMGLRPYPQNPYFFIIFTKPFRPLPHLCTAECCPLLQIFQYLGEEAKILLYPDFVKISTCTRRIKNCLPLSFIVCAHENQRRKKGVKLLESIEMFDPASKADIPSTCSLVPSYGSGHLNFIIAFPVASASFLILGFHLKNGKFQHGPWKIHARGGCWKRQRKITEWLLMESSFSGMGKKCQHGTKLSKKKINSWGFAALFLLKLVNLVPQPSLKPCIYGKPSYRGVLGKRYGKITSTLEKGINSLFFLKGTHGFMVLCPMLMLVFTFLKLGMNFGKNALFPTPPSGGAFRGPIVTPSLIERFPKKCSPNHNGFQNQKK
ncbi:hypothetical protein VP01_222g1 [Puccinia sorghi]|uniref:Uncharacterized protein n=1 Tax=Puccinia sorghi TaxID=27349 RepID=A0A0L6V9A6_9BASI|nr:hypothetical protein VP01_222g1 [Puccinia sorghi]